MLRSKPLPADHPPFAALPVTPVLLASGLRAMVHVSGQLSPDMLPVVCVPGYQRNMTDFAGFLQYFARASGGGWPMVLVDLPGRGRADNRGKAEDYSSLADARDLASILAALGISQTILFGQGHGGQVSMALAAEHPLLVAGTILLDSGPVTDSRGIVRLRNNVAHVEALRGKAVAAGFRRILQGNYPELPPAQLDELIGRSHLIDKRGRARPLYDKRLISALGSINFDDVLAPQWPLFEGLKTTPLMLIRTQLTDQLHKQTFEEMCRRRPDAAVLTIASQGSPALLSQAEDVEPIADFVRATNKRSLSL
jgi:pimeloyl-ACP methyl ester carboxylesterase